MTIIYEAYRKKVILKGILLILSFLSLMTVGIYKSDIAKEKFFAMFNYNVHQYNEPFKINKRYEEWKGALQVFQENPILGVGIGDVTNELQKTYLERGFQEGYEMRYGAHNLFLDTALACGILGLIAVLVLFYASFKNALKNLTILHIQFLFLFLCISLVESSFSLQKGVVFFSFINSLCIATNALRDRNISSDERSP
jgi:O-antigen ligase